MDTTITLDALALADLSWVSADGLMSPSLAAWGCCEWLPGEGTRAGGDLTCACGCSACIPVGDELLPRRTAPAFPPREVWQSFELLVDDLGLCATPAGGDTRCAA